VPTGFCDFLRPLINTLVLWVNISLSSRDGTVARSLGKCEHIAACRLAKLG
jgi:hypothetical protein